MTSANSVMLKAGDSAEFVSPYDIVPIEDIQVRGAGGKATFSLVRTG